MGPQARATRHRVGRSMINSSRWRAIPAVAASAWAAGVSPIAQNRNGAGRFHDQPLQQLSADALLADDRETTTS